MDLEENIDLILELWECSHVGKYAETNPSGMTLCGFKYGKLCEYQMKKDEEKECYCTRWYK